MESLDLANVIEIQNIRKVLIREPDLLAMFELLIIVANKRLNEDNPVDSMPIEKYIEPELDSDSEDDIILSTTAQVEY
tara:strand:+ start:2504 stop:2737 length:234 start_codon:yes stop_codon:yes gene_type:complete